MAFLATIHQVPWELAALLGVVYAVVGWSYSKEDRSP